MTLGLAYDIDAIAEKGTLLPKDWQKRLPHNSTPYTSTIVFLVRKGNPKGLKAWDDLIEARRRDHRSESENLRRRPLGVLGGLRDGIEEKRHRRCQSEEDFIADLYKNVPVLDSGARGATTTFVQRGIGVLP